MVSFLGSLAPLQYGLQDFQRFQYNQQLNQLNQLRMAQMANQIQQQQWAQQMAPSTLTAYEKFGQPAAPTPTPPPSPGDTQPQYGPGAISSQPLLPPSLPDTPPLKF